MRLARSVTTCSVAAPAGTITHATRGGRSARTKSSSAVVPVAPSLAIALTPAGSDAYPTISWPPRIRRRAMLAPIRPSPTIPTCMESSSRLEGPAQQDLVRLVHRNVCEEGHVVPGRDRSQERLHRRGAPRIAHAQRRLGRQGARPLVVVGQRARRHLARLDVGLVEGVDAENRSGDG